jgi:hypothetical protein
MTTGELTNQHVVCYISAVVLATVVLLFTETRELALIPPFAMWMLINRRKL